MPQCDDNSSCRDPAGAARWPPVGMERTGDTVTASWACELGWASVMRDERDRSPAGTMFAKSNDIFDEQSTLSAAPINA